MTSSDIHEAMAMNVAPATSGEIPRSERNFFFKKKKTIILFMYDFNNKYSYYQVSDYININYKYYNTRVLLNSRELKRIIILLCRYSSLYKHVSTST